VRARTSVRQTTERSTREEVFSPQPRPGRPARPVYIQIPGTPEGLAAIEDTIFAGVPVNVTLLFSPAQYLGFGHELQVKGARFCTRCGTALLDAPAPPSVGHRTAGCALTAFLLALTMLRAI
jgi:transaldolase